MNGTKTHDMHKENSLQIIMKYVNIGILLGLRPNIKKLNPGP